MKKWKKATERWTQQRDMFRNVRDTRNHISLVSWRHISEPRAVCFAHILPKWMFVKYRHDPRNIALVYDEIEHEHIDIMIMPYRKIILDMLEMWCTYEQIEEYILSIRKV